MNLPTYQMETQAAKDAYQQYRDALKQPNSQPAEDALLARMHLELSRGRPLLNLADAFRATGLDDEGYPKLAIAQAKQSRVMVNFSVSRPRLGDCEFFSVWRGKGSARIVLPKNTFPVYLSHRPVRETIVPNIPPALRPRSLEGYYILWEVEEWKLTPPRDPALLKPIGQGLYAVLAVWDLTDLERLAIGLTRGQP